MKHKHGNVARSLISILTAMFLLGACAPAAPPPAAPAKPAESKSAESKPAESKPAESKPAAAKPAPSQPAKTDLVVAVQSDAITVSPFEDTVITPDLQMGMNMYDPLVELDPAGKLVPALATSWEFTSPTSIKVALRQGVKFHNGEDFTAEDVKFSYETVIDPERKHKWLSTMGYVKNVEIVDPHTVVIHTKSPDAMSARKFVRLGIASAKYARDNPQILETKPNGTGPYRFVEWEKDTRVVMEAFDGHWRGAPQIKKVTWRPIKEDSARVAALLAGEVDVALNVPTDLIPQVNQSPRAEVQVVPSQRSYWLMMVNTGPELPTAKKEVRQAINYAINREELSKELFDGKAQPMATAITPKALGYNSNLKWEYDPAKAKELLAKAGYPNGFTVALHGSDGRYARDRELAQALAGQLAKVGITVEPKTVEVGQFTDRIFNKQTDPLVLYAFSDFDYDRTSTFRTSHATGQLWAVFSYPELDALMNKAATAMDEQERAKVIGEIQDWSMENAPAAYLMTLVDNYGVNKALKWQARPDDTLRWITASFQ